MNRYEKSTAIKSGLRKGFREGSSKLAGRKCYGYDTDTDGSLTINQDEAQVVHWIFERYAAGDSLWKIATGLEQHGIISPSGKTRWNREAIDKLLSNEKYTGRALLQKTISTGTSQIENDGLMVRYLYADHHEAIISDEVFQTVQEKKMSRSRNPDNSLSMLQLF